MKTTTLPTKSPVHGGLDVPVQRIDLSAASQAGLESIRVLPAQRAMLYRIADGTLSPLTGPMGITDVETVIERQAIDRGGEWWAWTIPMVLPITDAEAAHCEPGGTVALCDAEGTCFGHLKVHSCFDWEKERLLEAVYGTTRKDHAGARLWFEDERTRLVGGDILLIPETVEEPLRKQCLAPNQARSWIDELGLDATVAWPAERTLQRAQEFVLVAGAENLLRAGDRKVGAVLQAGVHGAGADGVPAEVRMATYEALVSEGAFGAGDWDRELWQSRAQEPNEQLTWMGLDMPAWHAGPAEVVLQAICAQNRGCTHMVVARQQAHGRFDDGAAMWGDFDAQQAFERLQGSLAIKTIPMGFAAYFEEAGRVGLVADHQGQAAVTLSEEEWSRQQREGAFEDERIWRPCTAQILAQHYPVAGNHQDEPAASEEG